ncbi:MAG: twin-arginine translocation signal domain-containing protein, partial [Anaerolineae bacterium]
MKNETLSRRKFLQLSAGVVGSAAVMTTAPRLLNRLAVDPKSSIWLETAVNERI